MFLIIKNRYHFGQNTIPILCNSTSVQAIVYSVIPFKYYRWHLCYLLNRKLCVAYNRLVTSI